MRRWERDATPRRPRRWDHDVPTKKMPAVRPPRDELEKMRRWLRKHGKGECLEKDVAWASLLREWFEKDPVGELQRCLASVGVTAKAEDLARAERSFYDFMDLVLYYDPEQKSHVIEENSARLHIIHEVSERLASL